MTKAQAACGRPTHGQRPCPVAAEQTDQELLRRFVHSRDDTAFALLVERHGPMVLGVCRRILGNSHDADDAFQATFLVLVRRADPLESPELLGNWLYGVAYRIARKARAQAARRRQQERQAAAVAATPEPLTDLAWRELRDRLDDELNRLPEKYRLPLILCYLQGLTNEEAARRLGWPSGSMSYRLARGRELLRRRLLGRHGAAPADFLILVLALAPAPATLPAPLTTETVQVAAGLLAGGQAAAATLSGNVRALVDAALQGMAMAGRRLWRRLLLLGGLAVAAALGLTLLLGYADSAVGGWDILFGPPGTGGAGAGTEPGAAGPGTPCHVPH
jgi:polysaccharide export outer membrane protein